MLSSIELVCFLIGAFMLTMWTWRFLVMIRRIFFGTKVSTARYGENSWAVVTGSTDGIGKALALELAKRGFNIVLIARNADKLTAVAKEIQTAHRRETRVIVFDFGKDTSIEAYQGIAKKLDGLDVSILVNNVGISSEPNEFYNISPENAHQECVVNCYSTALLTKVLVKTLEDRSKLKGTRSLILNLSSTLSIMNLPFLTGYCATKAFGDRFTKGLYYELSGSKVDVLGLLPGACSTKINGLPVQFFKVITADACAKGALDNATSYITYGGWVHEIHAFFIKTLLVDLMPLLIRLKLTKVIAEEIKSSAKSKRQ